MSKHQICKLCLCLVMALCELPLMAQGVIVYKKDGSKVKYPYETIDSIVTYNYDDVIEDDKVVEDEKNEDEEEVMSENRTFTVNGVSFTMVAVKGGTFTMGATNEDEWYIESDELPAHQVTLSDYYIGETEVTQELWQAVMGSNPSYYTGNLQRPVDHVSWNDCKTFITKLNTLTGETFSLPTEAEWEYAARGGSKSQGYLYSGSNTIDDVAWYSSNSSSTTHPVKTKLPNELGIYDMCGNLSEWCADWYSSSYYSSSPRNNPTGPSFGSNRVLRGGCYGTADHWCRVTSRSNEKPTYTGIVNHGLRLSL